jgi:isopentenyl-diphosphate delta-isomerase
VVLVDAEDGAIGSCDKLSAHRNGALHRAFSILIVNPAGELLLQRRAAHKYHFAGRWSNACCSHPRPGEQTPEAARRRLREELGFSVPLKEVGNLRYRAVDPRSELIEHEYLHVFEGTFAGESRPNPDEVGAYRWMRPSRVLRCVARRPDIFTPWFAILLDTLGTGSPRREAAEGTGGRRGGRDGAWSERDADAQASR